MNLISECLEKILKVLLERANGFSSRPRWREIRHADRDEPRDTYGDCL